MKLNRVAMIMAIWLCLAGTAQAKLPTEWQQFSPGPTNSLVDVAHIGVAHLTRHQPTQALATGATVILAKESSSFTNLATHGLWAGSAVLNGNGEMTGLHFVDAYGLLSSPIVLTNTQHVGHRLIAVQTWMRQRFKNSWAVGLPVVGECWDGALNKIAPAWQASELLPILDNAANTPSHTSFQQGRVGAGTGMRSFGLFGGIGSASRQVAVGKRTYTIGVLVNTNHSKAHHLLPAFKTALAQEIGPLDIAHTRVESAIKQAEAVASAPTPEQRQGSIIVIIATDAPLLPHQLKDMARHASIGLAALGSRLSTTSGDFALALSTANPIALEAPTLAPLTLTTLPHTTMNTLYEATIEAVVAAQYNGLVASNLPKGN